jgi:hypothetical protein
MLTRSMLFGALIATAAALPAGAQTVEPTPFPYNWLFGPYQYAYTPTAPPSWYYDPYTSGLGPCPQRYPSDPSCREMMPPSYGQPSFWTR